MSMPGHPEPCGGGGGGDDGGVEHHRSRLKRVLLVFRAGNTRPTRHVSFVLASIQQQACPLTVTPT